MNISGFKIELLVAEAGITKAELARRCGISRQNISAISNMALVNRAHWVSWRLVWVFPWLSS